MELKKCLKCRELFERPLNNYRVFCFKCSRTKTNNWIKRNKKILDNVNKKLNVIKVTRNGSGNDLTIKRNVRINLGNNKKRLCDRENYLNYIENIQEQLERDKQEILKNDFFE